MDEEVKNELQLSKIISELQSDADAHPRFTLEDRR